MVDFKKHLPEAQKTTRELQAAAARRWVLLYGPDLRPAAEIMTAELARIWRGHIPASTNWADGPAASQIFTEAVMREQVDPT